MKKANAYVNEFLNSLLSHKENDATTNVQLFLACIDAIRTDWENILCACIENEMSAHALAKGTQPTHIEDQTLHIKTSHADETMLISLHAGALLEQVKKNYAETSYAHICHELIKIKPVYYARR